MGTESTERSEPSGRARRAMRRLLGERLPQVDGRLSVSGLDGEVSVRRDARGVPHISAGTDHDAWFALGFCQAQDRSFQLDMTVRAATGRVSALVGNKGLEIDLLMRRIGLARASRAQIDDLDAQMRDAMTAFADGVNAQRAGCDGVHAHEFALLRAEPLETTPADVLAVVKLVAMGLSTNFDSELARLRTLLADGPGAMSVEGGYREDHPVVSPAGGTGGTVVDLTRQLDRLGRIGGLNGASNAWAVAGSRTASGRPILASDPHLNPAYPSHWYLAHVTTPEFDVAGATLVGGPGVVIGHNGRVAWGVTSARTDMSDLVIEEYDAVEGTVRRPSGPVSCEVAREVIDVRGRRAPIELRVPITDTGPIITDPDELTGPVLSLRAAWLGDRLERGFIEASRCSSVDQLRRAFDVWCGPSVNLVMIDDSGSIGWQFVAEAPIRVNGPSRVPTSGSDPDEGWTGDVVPFADLPHAVDPDDGILVSANNQPSADHPRDLGDEWADGYRATRITDALLERTDWTCERTAALQLDVLSLPMVEFVDLLAREEFSGTTADRAWQLLAGFDGHMRAESVPAALAHVAFDRIAARIAASLAPSSAAVLHGEPTMALTPYSGLVPRSASRTLRLLAERPDGMFANGWSQMLRDELSGAWRDVADRDGHPRPLGVLRPLQLDHPLADLPFIGDHLRPGPFEWGGDLNTISMCSSVPGEPATTAASATVRCVIEAGEWDSARFALPGGQSGNPFSPWSADQLPLWTRGGAINIAYSPAAVDDATRHELVLSPR